MPFIREFSERWNCSLEGVEHRACGDVVNNQCSNGDCVLKVPGLALSTCDCWPGWIGDQCDICCDIPCVNNATCMIDSKSKLPYCSCTDGPALNYTGPYCEELDNKTVDTVYIHSSSNSTDWEVPVIVTSVLLCLIAACMFATLYGMYRRRHPWLVMILISMQRRFINDGDRTYDAYLSYQSSNDKDRKFVVFKLLPFLEKRGFSVCIDQRDFIPGAAIANSIAEAITESKRTILLLSPSYVDGEWPEFEVQCALKESLQRNHRIIPIVYEPLDEVEKELSATLRHVVDSIKCLKWPAAENATEGQRWTRFFSRLHNSVTWVKTHLKFSRKDDDLDPVAAKEEQFWRRLLVTLPKREAETSARMEDPDKAIKSFQSQTSLQSNASETNELIRVERATKSNLFNRRHFDNVQERTKPKIVHVVRPQPRRTSETTTTENTEESRRVVEVANKPSTAGVLSNHALMDSEQNPGACCDALQTVSSSSTESAENHHDVISVSPRKGVTQMKLNIGFDGDNVEMC